MSASNANSPSGNPPSNNLWIGNVSAEVTDSELKALFEKYGRMDSVTLYPARSYAFLHFKETEAAVAAKESLQGYFLHGNSLKIEFAKPAKPCKSLWVAGISQSVTKEELEKEFSRFGKIEEFRFLKDRNTAYVNYFRLEDASQALKIMNGKQFGGDQIRVDYLRSQSSRREQGLEAKEGQFPNRSMGHPDMRWMTQDSMKNQTESNLIGSSRDHQLLSSGARKGDVQLTKVLWISHPPSVVLEREMLHNAMILFGEINWIKIIPERHCAFVVFRSVEEARRAKEGLEGKLFNDPRILIEYSSSERLPSKEHISHVNEIPFQPVQMDILGPNGPILANNNPGYLPPIGIHGLDIYSRPLGLHSAFEPARSHPEFGDMADFPKLQNPSPHALIGGPNWRRFSPTPGFVPSPSAVLNPSNQSTSGSWDVFEASQLQRESKRSRIDVTVPGYDNFPNKRIDDRAGSDEQYVSGKLGSIGASGSVGRVTTTALGQRHTESDYIWRGIIAKGGSPVCQARCVPIGEWIGSMIPDMVNCSAKTGLETLTRHYEDAIGFNIVFFLPDSEEDFASYTEFLSYLGSRNRAGVAKFDDGTTLFLVPPSDFLTKVLNVNGPKRLYGVVLKFPEVEPSITSMKSRSLQLPYVDSQQTTSLQAGYDIMPQEERVAQKGFPRFVHESSNIPPKTSVPVASGSYSGQAAPPINSAVAAQAKVTLTPEVIATLASLLPATNRSHSENASSKVAAVADPELANWTHGHQPLVQTGNLVQQLGSRFTNQSQHVPQAQSLSGVSNIQSHFHQGAASHNQMNTVNLPPQGTISPIPMASVVSSQSGLIVPEVDSHYQLGSSQAAVMGHKVNNDTDALRLYNTSAVPLYPVSLPNQVQDTSVSQSHATPQASGADLTNQGQQLLSAPYGVVEESAESEADKNERYKTTLLFAANLLARIHQPQGNQAGQGAGSQ